MREQFMQRPSTRKDAHRGGPPVGLPHVEIDRKNMLRTATPPGSIIAPIEAAAIIDIFAETLLDLRQACRLPVFLNPRTNQPLHLSGMYRHILRGARAANGERIRLEVIRTPSGLRTSREAVARFITALNAKGDQTSPPRSIARKREIMSAEQELADAGFDLAPDDSVHPTDRPS